MDPSHCQIGESGRETGLVGTVSVRARGKAFLVASCLADRSLWDQPVQAVAGLGRCRGQARVFGINAPKRLKTTRSLRQGLRTPVALPASLSQDCCVWATAIHARQRLRSRLRCRQTAQAGVPPTRRFAQAAGSQMRRCAERACRAAARRRCDAAAAPALKEQRKQGGQCRRASCRPPRGLAGAGPGHFCWQSSCRRVAHMVAVSIVTGAGSGSFVRSFAPAWNPASCRVRKHVCADNVLTPPGGRNCDGRGGDQVVGPTPKCTRAGTVVAVGTVFMRVVLQ